MKNTIRGMVYSKYSSIRKFASDIGWDKMKAWSIVNGKREPRISDLQEMSVLLDCSVEELAHLFLSSPSQNCDKTG